jgi:hypothetical protein
MIEIGALATTLGGLLAPAMPYLLTGAGTAANEAAKQLGPETWELAKTIWARIGPRIEAHPAARDAAQKAADKPTDTRVRGALELQLEDFLNEDGALAAELGRLVEAAAPRGAVHVEVSGERAVGIGGNVSGGTIITGDNQPAKG